MVERARSAVDSPCSGANGALCSIFRRPLAQIGRYVVCGDRHYSGGLLVRRPDLGFCNSELRRRARSARFGSIGYYTSAHLCQLTAKSTTHRPICATTRSFPCSCDGNALDAACCRIADRPVRSLGLSGIVRTGMCVFEVSQGTHRSLGTRPMRSASCEPAIAGPRNLRRCFSNVMPSVSGHVRRRVRQICS